MLSQKNIIIILSVIGALGASIYIFDYASSLYEHEPSILESGEYGNLYVDREAGFQIKKPNQNWEFVTDVEKDEQVTLVIGDDVLAIMTVKSRTGETVIIEVYEENTLFDKDMEKIIDRVIHYFNSEFAGEREWIIYNKNISPDGDYASFYMLLKFSEDLAIQNSVIIQIINEKAYIFVSVSQVLDESSNRMKELQSVIDSFEIIP